jgi:hypothetical protein
MNKWLPAITGALILSTAPSAQANSELERLRQDNLAKTIALMEATGSSPRSVAALHDQRARSVNRDKKRSVVMLTIDGGLEEKVQALNCQTICAGCACGAANGPFTAPPVWKEGL